MASLTEALSRVGNQLWRVSDSDRGLVTWLPMWLFSSSGLWVGLDRDGRWTVGRVPGRAATLMPQTRLPQAWLPLLDHDESVVKEELTYASSKFGLPLEFLHDSMPIDDIIRIALATSSPHWINRALSWLDWREIPEDVYDLLEKVSVSKPAGQQARHHASRLIKRRAS